MFREVHLQRVWAYRLFRQDGLLTEDARPVVVEFPGIPSVEGGPDFRDARLRIGGVPVTGDVELHLTTDGWRDHAHDRNGAYDATILHVALDRGRAPGRAGLAELILAPYLDRSRADLAEELEPPLLSARVSDTELDRWGERRFERRVERLRRLLASASTAQVFYREILIGLGYKHNKAPFAELARLVPLSSLEGLARDGIERRLAEAARDLPWRVRGVRPANRPRRRIEGAANWLAAAGTRAPHRPYLERPMEASFDPERIGPDREADLRANVVLPMAVAAGSRKQAEEARRWFARLPGGHAHRRLRDAEPWIGIGRATTLRRAWGILELMSRGVSPFR